MSETAVPSGVRLAFYGDDFTGSVDVMLQLDRAGWSSRLLLQLPGPDELVRAASGVDAVGIAGIARSLPTADIEAEVRPAFEALAALGPRIVQYKACSTADSSPTIGSIGRVIEVAREVFGPATVPVLFAQPDFGRYTNFGHHFAAEGGVVYRLDRQPTMSRHPSTPMHESDLALHLSAQTGLPIGSLHRTTYRDAGAVAGALAASGDAATVLDATNDEDILVVAEAIVRQAGSTPMFAVGSGGLSSGLGRVLGGAVGGILGSASAAAGARRPLNPPGPVLAVSGSRSPQTARQIEHARLAGWVTLSLPLGAAGGPSAALEALRSAVLAELAAGRSVVVSTADAVAADSPELVATIAAGLGTLVEAALRGGITRRVIVCGGDTSSRILTMLSAESLAIAANPVDNVVLCSVGSAEPWLDGAQLLLKGGQVGPVDLFEMVRLLDV